MVADFQGNGFNRLAGGSEKFGRTPHPQICDLMHGAAAQLAAAQAPEVFVAVTRFAREPGKRPFIRQMRGNPLPQESKVIGLIRWLREAQDVSVDQIRPFVEEGGLSRPVAFVEQAENRGAQRQRVETRHDGRCRVGHGTLFRRPLVTDPTAFPARSGNSFKGVERVRRQQACKSLAANPPTPVNQHPSLAAITGEKVRGRLLRAHDARGGDGLQNANVEDLILPERRTHREIFDPRTQFDIRSPHAPHPRARAVNCQISQFLMCFRHKLGADALILAFARTSGQQNVFSIWRHPLPPLSPSFGSQELWLMRAAWRSTMEKRSSQPMQMTMKKNPIQSFIRMLACAFLMVLAGCGKSESPTAQPEADAVFFERTCARASSLIASKDYPQARSTLDTFKNYKLTEEQKKIMDQLEAQIPKSQ